MRYDKSIQNIFKRIEGIKESQSKLDEELLYVGKWLDELIDNMDSVSKCLKEIGAQRAASQSKPKTEKTYMSEQDFKALLEKLLQGSLEHLGDKISGRIMDKLKELKETSGPQREVKIKELKEVADSETVDLTKLFHEKIESNIDQIGVDEKESKGIDKSLEKLRKMKEGKVSQDSKDNSEKTK